MYQVIYSLIGLFAGAIGGLFGISGALIIVTMLTFFKLVPSQNIAAGTTLFTILPPISITALYVYYKNKEVNFKVGLIIMIFYMIGGYIGAKLAHILTEKELALGLGLLLLSLSVFSFKKYLSL